MLHLIRIGITTGLWTVAVVLLTVRTVAYDDIRFSVLTGWALLFGMAACVTTGWCLLVHERHRIEHIAEVVAAEYQRQLRAVD